MKIALSADCFSAFTSGHPVRGMALELIKMRPQDKFVLFYVRRKLPEMLSDFYRTINSLPNVEVRTIPGSHTLVGVKRLLGIPYMKLEKDFDFFLNPGHAEYLSNFSGPQLGAIADLSSFNGFATTKAKIPSPRWFKIWRRRCLLNKFSHLIAISEYTRQDYLRTIKCSRPQIHVIHNGIDQSWFSSDYDFEHENVKAFSGKKYWIWWGLVSVRKNLCRLISAYNRLRRQYGDSIPDLLIVGSIPDNLPYPESEITGRLDDKIHHLPFQDGRVLRTLVHQSSGVLFPSLYEGFGLPVIEGFSQNKQVVYAAVTSLPEVAGGYGIACDPVSEDSIFQALDRLRQNPVPSGDVRKYAEQFTYRRAAEKFSELIDSIAAESKKQEK